jgi:dynein heavy chain 1
MSLLRDLPPVSGSIIWAKQIERHLDIYLQRVEDVLGKRWFHHVEGQRLKSETDQFRARLQPNAIFQAWLADAQKLGDFEIEARIFSIVSNKKSVELCVNFDRQMVTLFKEVRNLERLGLKVPYEIKISANEVPYFC